MGTIPVRAPPSTNGSLPSARGKPLGSGEADSPQVGPVAALAVHREPQKSGQHALSPSFSQEVFRELCKN